MFKNNIKANIAVFVAIFICVTFLFVLIIDVLSKMNGSAPQDVFFFIITDLLFSFSIYSHISLSRKIDNK